MLPPETTGGSVEYRSLLIQAGSEKHRGEEYKQTFEESCTSWGSRTESGQELDFGQQQRRSGDRLPLVDALFNVNPTLKPFGVVHV